MKTTQTEYTYLKFPGFEEFLEYVKKYVHGSEIAGTQNRLIKEGWLTYFIRLTVRMPRNHQILICDTTIYKGFNAHKPAEEKLSEMKNKVWAKIDKAAKKILGDEVKIIDAEHKLEP